MGNTVPMPKHPIRAPACAVSKLRGVQCSSLPQLWYQEVSFTASSVLFQMSCLDQMAGNTVLKDLGSM